MIFHTQEEEPTKRQLSQLNETLNDFIYGNGTIVNAIKNETLEQQIKSPRDDFENFDKSLCQNPVLESNTDDRIRKAVDNAVIAVENRTQDAKLTTMNDVVIPRVEMAVSLITSSSGNGHNSIVQNPGRRDFAENTENTPLRSTSSRLDLNIEQDAIDETRDIDDSEDGDFRQQDSIMTGERTLIRSTYISSEFEGKFIIDVNKLI